MFNNETVIIIFENGYAYDFSNAVKDKAAYYLVFSHNSVLKMKFVNNETIETKEEAQTRNSPIAIDLIESFGEENVSFDEETEFFSIKTKNRVFAKSFTGKNDWKFLNYKEDENEILKKIIPKKILSLK